MGKLTGFGKKQGVGADPESPSRWGGSLPSKATPASGRTASRRVRRRCQDSGSRRGYLDRGRKKTITCFLCWKRSGPLNRCILGRKNRVYSVKHSPKRPENHRKAPPFSAEEEGLRVGARHWQHSKKKIQDWHIATWTEARRSAPESYERQHTSTSNR